MQFEALVQEQNSSAGLSGAEVLLPWTSWGTEPKRGKAVEIIRSSAECWLSEQGWFHTMERETQGWAAAAVGLCSGGNPGPANLDWEVLVMPRCLTLLRILGKVVWPSIAKSLGKSKQMRKVLKVMGVCLCSRIHTVWVLAPNYLQFELQLTSWTALWLHSSPLCCFVHHMLK